MTHARQQWHMHVLWDYANCFLSPGTVVPSVLEVLQEQVRAGMAVSIPEFDWNGRRPQVFGKVVVQLDRIKPEFALTQHQIEDLNDWGFDVVNPGAKKGADDSKMLGSAIAIAQNLQLDPSLNVVVIISGDRDMSSAVHALHNAAFEHVFIFYSLSRQSYLSLVRKQYRVRWADVRDAAMQRHEGAADETGRRTPPRGGSPPRRAAAGSHPERSPPSRPRDDPPAEEDRRCLPAAADEDCRPAAAAAAEGRCDAQHQLIVRGLPPSWDNGFLFRRIKSLGYVKSIAIETSGSVRQALVVMGSRQHAMNVAEALHDSELDEGYPCTCEVAPPAVQRA
eukprot:TRINITY_DN8238_c0_g2_i1.p1 TRINITY_DN8238_c0_g2~~TRINITY_DN8238_c0_g2_i1.p1  ORF type:complete len:336 (+),score=91.43 TRINITY_DN8238_c0_g2_i1:65-1072(+)